MKRRYRNASIFEGNRVVFNIGGDNYRLVVQINFEFRIIYIQFVGSHEAYDNVEAETVQMTIRPIRNSSDYESALKRVQAPMASKPGTTEVLNKRRRLSLKMIRSLHEEVDIP